MLEALIKQLAEENDLQDLTTEVPGAYALPLENNLSMMITEIPRGFVLSSVLGPCPRVKTEDFFTEVLHANLFGQGTSGAILGLDIEGNMLTLSQAVEHVVDYEDFTHLIEEFINAIDYWRTETLDWTNASTLT